MEGERREGGGDVEDKGDGVWGKGCEGGGGERG